MASAKKFSFELSYERNIKIKQETMSGGFLMTPNCYHSLPNGMMTYTEFSIYSVLLDYVNLKDGWTDTCPKQRTIAKRIGKHRTTVSVAMDKFRKLGLIATQRNQLASNYFMAYSLKQASEVWLEERKTKENQEILSLEKLSSDLSQVCDFTNEKVAYWKLNDIPENDKLTHRDVSQLTSDVSQLTSLHIYEERSNETQNSESTSQKKIENNNVFSEAPLEGETLDKEKNIGEYTREYSAELSAPSHHYNAVAGHSDAMRTDVCGESLPITDSEGFTFVTSGERSYYVAVIRDQLFVKSTKTTEIRKMSLAPMPRDLNSKEIQSVAYEVVTPTLRGAHEETGGVVEEEVVDELPFSKAKQSNRSNFKQKKQGIQGISKKKSNQLETVFARFANAAAKKGYHSPQNCPNSKALSERIKEHGVENASNAMEFAIDNWDNMSSFFPGKSFNSVPTVTEISIAWVMDGIIANMLNPKALKIKPQKTKAPSHVTKSNDIEQKHVQTKEHQGVVEEEVVDRKSSSDMFKKFGR